MARWVLYLVLGTFFVRLVRIVFGNLGVELQGERLLAVSVHSAGVCQGVVVGILVVVVLLGSWKGNGG